jgi:hypothetical protein
MAKAEAKVGNDNASKAETKTVQSGQVLNHKPKPEAKSRAVIADAAKAGNQNAAKESLNIEDKNESGPVWTSCG